MKAKNIHITLAANFLFPALLMGQHTFFNTVEKHDHTPTVYMTVEEEYIDTVTEEEPERKKTVEELQDEINAYLAKRDSMRRNVVNVVRIGNTLSLYNSNSSMPLSYSNIVKVMDEVGIRQQLYVIAQACLETGYFTSRVFREYNNLFGLFDSRKNDYYRFTKWEDSVVAYKRYIQYRYSGGDYLAFLRRIKYAGDPDYTNKVRKIAKSLINK